MKLWNNKIRILESVRHKHSIKLSQTKWDMRDNGLMVNLREHIKNLYAILRGTYLYVSGGLILVALLKLVNSYELLLGCKKSPPVLRFWWTRVLNRFLKHFLTNKSNRYLIYWLFSKSIGLTLIMN